MYYTLYDQPFSVGSATPDRNSVRNERKASIYSNGCKSRRHTTPSSRAPVRPNFLRRVQSAHLKSTFLCTLQQNGITGIS